MHNAMAPFAARDRSDETRQPQHDLSVHTPPASLSSQRPTFRLDAPVIPLLPPLSRTGQSDAAISDARLEAIVDLTREQCLAILPRLTSLAALVDLAHLLATRSVAATHNGSLTEKLNGNGDDSSDALVAFLRAAKEDVSVVTEQLHKLMAQQRAETPYRQWSELSELVLHARGVMSRDPKLEQIKILLHSSRTEARVHVDPISLSKLLFRIARCLASRTEAELDERNYQVEIHQDQNGLSICFLRPMDERQLTTLGQLDKLLSDNVSPDSSFCSALDYLRRLKVAVRDLDYDGGRKLVVLSVPCAISEA
jgi:hypothetical protein